MRELKLYNTLTREKQVFQPIDPDKVRMYVCGPTVYDFAHIGNARPVIVFDVLFRLLNHLYGADHVTYVRNITDVEDKINARALRDYGDKIDDGSMALNEAIRAVTEKTAEQFQRDAKALGCLEPTFEPRATQHIDGMIEMIAGLIARGNAYVARGGEGQEVLFDVSSMPEYGQLSKRNLDEQQAGARIAVEKHKKNPADFVLWKESSQKEPGWDAVFQQGSEMVAIRGRPGWHIECSVMSAAHLGEVFDIHGGGLDLIFPHHENEIAQSRCAHGTDVMANVWMHNGFLQVEGRKMSKSEGNFVTIYDLLHTEKFGGRKWPGEVLRLAMLMTHYREPIDFSVKRLEEANSTAAKWKRKSLSRTLKVSELTDERFLDSLKDDLNTPAAIRRIGEMFSSEELMPFAENAVNLLGLRNLFGAEVAIPVTNIRLSAPDIIVEAGLSAEQKIKQIIAHRLALLAEKNFAEADRIRDDLAAQGIQLMDYKDPATGERKTKWEVKR